MTTPGHLVSVAWLRDHLDDEHVQVVDCRFDLFDEDAGRRAWLEGHVPGASFLSLKHDLSGEAGDNLGGRHPLPTADDFGASARRAGIGHSTHVVAYDDRMSGGAARLWWLLRHFGHDAVSVLDGGMEAWDGPLETGEHHPEPGDLEPGTPADDVVDADTLLARRGSDSPPLVVDARGPTRYRGEEEPIDPVAGHIPGAINLPSFEAFPPPPDVVDAPGDVVVYCGSGVTATTVLLSLAAAGREDARLYPGSWSEWSRRGLPVATGDGT